MKTVDFLDAVKQRHRLTSDYQLAHHLNWTTQRISIYRAGRRELDDAAALQIAEALDVPPAYVMACIAGARAKDAAIKKHWAAAAKLLKHGTAAVILATVGALAQIAPAPASASSAVELNDLYIMRRRRRRLAGEPQRRRRRRKLRTVIVAAADLPDAGNTLAG